MSFFRRRTALAAACLSAAVLSACAPLPSRQDAPAGVIAPNANLVVQGIPPVPASIASTVARYNDFRGHRFVAWHPTRREMLVAHRRAGVDTTQVFRLTGPLAEPEPLTDGGEPVFKASYEPTAGSYVVFERGSGGDEAGQLHRLDLATKQTTRLTELGERHDMQAWLHGSAQLLYLSVPLDRTARDGRRDEIAQTLWLLDPMRPQARRRLADLPGGGWSAEMVSWDDSTVALTRYVSALRSEVWLLDLATGAKRQVLPAAGAAPATHFAAVWKRDGSGLFFISDRGGEFRELMFYRLRDAAVAPVSRRIPWDIVDVSLDASGRLLAVRANVEGRNEMRFFDPDTFDELPAPRLPEGSVAVVGFHPRLPSLAVSYESTSSPSSVAVVDAATGAVQPWTTPYVPPGVDTTAFGAQSIIRWKSFDGREISGLLNAPPARFTGRRPVLIDIHGGPESQAQFRFLGRVNYFVEELGIAVIRPNVRGSSGFGKTFLSLDDGIRREDSVKDIGALLDWIALQPGLDPARVMVSGGSYGGYMSLAVATHYTDRITASIDVVGISNFVSFLQNTESYRRDLRRAEYGDEREPAMRSFLESISPLNRADRIRKPLFVIQGANDPRVPRSEAEQIVRTVRGHGTSVWYLLAMDEGHGFAKKSNADFAFYTRVMFAEQCLN